MSALRLRIARTENEPGEILKIAVEVDRKPRK